MAKLTTKKRDSLKKSTFGLPGERKYPMPDRSHAANAKARATQQLNKGNISKAQKSEIDKKASKVLGKTKSSPTKRSSKMKRQTGHDKSDEKKGEMNYTRHKSKDKKDERRGEKAVSQPYHQTRKDRKDEAKDWGQKRLK